MRVNLPTASESYELRSRKLSAQRLVNVYPEVNPSARQTVAFHTRPGLTAFASVDPGDRGIHKMNETLYVVGGQSLFSITSDGTTTEIGPVPGSGRCIMADDGQQLLIATGGDAYIYTLGGFVTAVTDTDLYSPTWFTWINSQFVFDQNNGTFGQWGVSEVTATFSVDPLDTATAEAFPDDVIRGIAFNQYLYLFGSESFEVWYNSGTGRPPFSRVQGGVRNVGIAGRYAICATPDALYMLDDDRIPRRGSGFDLQNIGNPALGVELAKYSQISDCVVSTFVLDHQRFVQYSFPAANHTWCFHEPSGRWFEMVYGKDRDMHRVIQVQDAWGVHYGVDHSDGTVYQIDQCAYTDNGEPIRRICTMPPLHGGLFGAPGQKLFFDAVEFIIGQGPCNVQPLGAGAEPAPAQQTELCGSLDDLEQGGVLPETSLVLPQSSSVATRENLRAFGLSPSDSKNVVFTAAFVRESEPQVETDVRDGKAYIIDFYDDNSSALRHQFSVFMDTNGFIKVEGRDSAGTIILDVSISNNGASFADSTAHMIAFVADMESEGRREVWVDGVEVQNNASYVTWTTYTDAAISYTDLNVNGDMNVRFGGNSARVADTWGGPDSAADTNGWTTGIDRLGFVSWDNTCSLIPGACWNDDGWVRDPQAWNGWYLTQPYAFFTNSFMRNTGTWGRMVEVQAWASSYENTSDIYNDPEAGMVNAGIGGTV